MFTASIPFRVPRGLQTITTRLQLFRPLLLITFFNVFNLRRLNSARFREYTHTSGRNSFSSRFWFLLINSVIVCNKNILIKLSSFPSPNTVSPVLSWWRVLCWIASLKICVSALLRCQYSLSRNNPALHNHSPLWVTSMFAIHTVLNHCVAAIPCSVCVAK